jgi:hypothetical protein
MSQITPAANSGSEQTQLGAWIHTVEVMGGVCLACIVALTVTSPLNLRAQWSLCMFSIALPVFAAIRVDLRHPGVLKRAVWFKLLLYGAILIAVIALGLLIWSAHSLAALLFAGSGVVVVVLLVGTNPFRAKQRATARTFQLI